MSVNRDEGKQAFRKRQGLETNPHEVGTQAFIEWNEGWTHTKAHAPDYGLRRASQTDKLPHLISETTEVFHIPKPLKNCPGCKVTLQACELSDDMVDMICPKCNESFGMQ